MSFKAKFTENKSTFDSLLAGTLVESNGKWTPSMLSGPNKRVFNIKREVDSTEYERKARSFDSLRADIQDMSNLQDKDAAKQLYAAEVQKHMPSIQHKILFEDSHSLKAIGDDQNSVEKQVQFWVPASSHIDGTACNDASLQEQLQQAQKAVLENARLRSLHADMVSEVQDTQAALADVRRELQLRDNALAACEEEVEELRSRCQQLQAGNAQDGSRMKALEAEVLKLRNDLTAAVAANTELQHESQAVMARKVETGRKLGATMKKLKEVNDSLVMFEGRSSRLAQERSALLERLSGIRAQNVSLQRDVHRANEARLRAEQEAYRLAEELRILRSGETSTSTVNQSDDGLPYHRQPPAATMPLKISGSARAGTAREQSQPSTGQASANTAPSARALAGQAAEQAAEKGSSIDYLTPERSQKEVGMTASVSGAWATPLPISSSSPVRQMGGRMKGPLVPAVEATLRHYQAEPSTQLSRDGTTRPGSDSVRDQNKVTNPVREHRRVQEKAGPSSAYVPDRSWPLDVDAVMLMASPYKPEMAGSAAETPTVSRRMHAAKAGAGSSDANTFDVKSPVVMEVEEVWYAHSHTRQTMPATVQPSPPERPRSQVPVPLERSTIRPRLLSSPQNAESSKRNQLDDRDLLVSLSFASPLTTRETLLPQPTSASPASPSRNLSMHSAAHSPPRRPSLSAATDLPHHSSPLSDPNISPGDAIMMLETMGADEEPTPPPGLPWSIPSDKKGPHFSALSTSEQLKPTTSSRPGTAGGAISLLTLQDVLRPQSARVTPSTPYPLGQGGEQSHNQPGSSLLRLENDWLLGGRVTEHDHQRPISVPLVSSGRYTEPGIHMGTTAPVPSSSRTATLPGAAPHSWIAPALDGGSGSTRAPTSHSFISADDHTASQKHNPAYASLVKDSTPKANAGPLALQEKLLTANALNIKPFIIPGGETEKHLLPERKMNAMSPSRNLDFSLMYPNAGILPKLEPHVSSKLLNGMEQISKPVNMGTGKGITDHTILKPELLSNTSVTPSSGEPSQFSITLRDVLHSEDANIASAGGNRAVNSVVAEEEGQGQRDLNRFRENGMQRLGIPSLTGSEQQQQQQHLPEQHQQIDNAIIVAPEQIDSSQNSESSSPPIPAFLRETLHPGQQSTFWQNLDAYLQNQNSPNHVPVGNSSLAPADLDSSIPSAAQSTSELNMVALGEEVRKEVNIQARVTENSGIEFPHHSFAVLQEALAIQNGLSGQGHSPENSDCLVSGAKQLDKKQGEDQGQEHGSSTAPVMTDQNVTLTTSPLGGKSKVSDIIARIEALQLPCSPVMEPKRADMGPATRAMLAVLDGFGIPSSNREENA